MKNTTSKNLSSGIKLFWTTQLLFSIFNKSVWLGNLWYTFQNNPIEVVFFPLWKSFESCQEAKFTCSQFSGIRFLTTVDIGLKTKFIQQWKMSFLHDFLISSKAIFQERFPWWLSGNESACSVGHLGLIPGLGRSLEKGKATHSSILAWRIPWTA